MSSKKHIGWLYEQLPELEKQGVLSAETSTKLRGHYGEVQPRSGLRIALTIFSILGALLIGSGTILLLAHNWSGMSRAVRTLLSIAPLAVTQALAFWIVYKNKTSAAWREGIGILVSLAVAAAIALVGQTYHIPGDLGDFLFIWMLLIIPLVYVLRATVPIIIYLIGITFWAGYQQECGGHALMFWPLFALTLPHLWMEARKDPYSPRSVVGGWALCFCLCVATGITMEKVMPGLWIVVYSALFAALYLAGSYWFDADRSLLAKPYHTIGAGGIACISFLFTFEFPWEEVGWSYYRYSWRFHSNAAWPDYVLACVLPVTAIALLVMALRRKQASRILYGVMPIITILCYVVSCLIENEVIPMLVFNLYVLLLGIGTIVAGAKRLRLGLFNGGMIILTALFLARFFDYEMDFISRGIAFILLGTAFLVTNLLLGRKARRAAA